MTAGRVSAARTVSRLVAILAPVALLAGCGQSNSSRALSLDQLPLLPGSKIVARAQQCDKGANAYCALEAVIVDARFKNSQELVDAEHDWVHNAGWNGVTADTGNERAAESPGHRYRVTYATASGDLTGIDLGWIKRSRTIAYALSKSLFAHAPAMSILLETGES
jgi:hypothetical protein